MLVLLILPQDPNNRSSAAQTIEDGVCASPRITTVTIPVGKVSEGSAYYWGWHMVFVPNIQELDLYNPVYFIYIAHWHYFYWSKEELWTNTKTQEDISSTSTTLGIY